VEIQKQRLVKAIANGIDPEIVKGELRALEEKISFLTQHIEEMKQENNVPTISEDMIFDLICQSRDFLKSHNRVECRKFLETYIEKVLVYRDNVEVKLKINLPSNVNV
jgi:site-specific DNA recombinase